MSESATRDDIDEVISIVKDFMAQVDKRFTHIESEISELKESHYKLLNTIVLLSAKTCGTLRINKA